MTNKVRIVTYIDKKTAEIIRENAEKDNRTISNYIELLLINALNNPKK